MLCMWSRPKSSNNDIVVCNGTKTVCAACYKFSIEVTDRIFTKYLYANRFLTEEINLPVDIFKVIISLLLEDRLYDNFKCFYSVPEDNE